MDGKSFHHLMRVRVRTSTFKELQEIAERESDQSGEYTSVSDLVRIAISNWIRTQRNVHDLNARINSSIQRKSSLQRRKG